MLIAGRSRCEITSVREISSQSASAARTESTGTAIDTTRSETRRPAGRSRAGEFDETGAALTPLF